MNVLLPHELERIRNGPPRPCPGCGCLPVWQRGGGAISTHPADCPVMIRRKDLDRFHDELDGET